MQQAGGVEFATFRLREGVTEADLLALSRRSSPSFLSSNPGSSCTACCKRRRRPLCGRGDGPSQSLVEAYCQQWLHNDVAGEYLTLLDHDSVNMSFWTRIG